MNVMLPLQFRHPGPPFPTLLRPAGHPQNSLKFWSVSWSVGRSVGQSVGRSVGHRVVTQTSRCLFSFVTRSRPFRPFYALGANPKTALNFGWSVGWLVGWSVGRPVGQPVGWSVGHGEVRRTSCYLFSFVTRARPSRPFYALQATPKTALNFGRSVSRSVGWLVMGKSHECHAASSVSSPGPALPDSSTPCRPPQNGFKFWLVGQSVGRSVGRLVSWSVGHREVRRTSRCLFSFVTRAHPSRPFYARRATPKTA
jgi:hypothetical protein